MYMKAEKLIIINYSIPVIRDNDSIILRNHTMLQLMNVLLH